MIEPFERIYTPGRIGERIYVFVKAKWDGKRLSITGVEGPKRGGNCHGGCGQIQSNSAEWLGGDLSASDTLALLEIWERWHLNDMRAGCEHQMADGWDKRPIDPSKPLHAYGRHCEGQKSDSWNMLSWLRPDEHPDGLLTVPCPECGYKWGTSWLTEEVPEEVLQRLLDIPETKRIPAWV